jgi:hypothetical protein
MSSQKWLDLKDFRHARYNKHKTNGESINIFRGKRFFLGNCSDPPIEVVRALIESAGGVVSYNIEKRESGSEEKQKSDFFVFGN